MKKIIASFLTICICTGLMTGCSVGVSAESLLKNGDKTISSAKSISSEMDLSIDASISFSGLSMDMGINGNIDTESHMETESSHSIGELEVEFFGQSQKQSIENYTVKDNNKYVSYTSDEDGNWTYKKLDESEYDITSTNMYKNALENIDSFNLLKEKEEFNNKDCYVVSGTIAGDFLDDVLGETEYSEFTSGDLNFDDFKFTTKMYFDENKIPVGLSVYTDEAIKITEEETDISFDTFDIVIIYTGFDNVNEIKVPDNVLDKAVEFDEEDFTVEMDPETMENSDSDDYSSEEYIDYIDGMEGLILNGKELSLPCNVKDIVFDNLHLNEDYIGYVLNPGDSTSAFIESDDVYISIMVYNDKDKVAPVEECKVYGITFYADDIGDIEFSSKLGFDMNSTNSDLESVLGTPTYTFDGEYLTNYTWETEDYTYSIDVDFDSETGSIYSISIQNYYMY